MKKERLVAAVIEYCRLSEKNAYNDLLFSLRNANIKRENNQRGLIAVQVTDVRIRKITKEGKMKAIVSITLDDEFVIHDIKIIEGEKGMFIAMPSRRAGDGEYRDIAHPINSDTREKVQKMILDKYEAILTEEPDGLENE